MKSALKLWIKLKLKIVFKLKKQLIPKIIFYKWNYVIVIYKSMMKRENPIFINEIKINIIQLNITFKIIKKISHRHLK